MIHFESIPLRPFRCRSLEYISVRSLRSSCLYLLAYIRPVGLQGVHLSLLIVMRFLYSFTSLDEAQLQQRRHTLDIYGQFAQVSILFPLICYHLPSLFRFLRTKFRLFLSPRKTKEHASPFVSSFDESSLAPQQISKSSWPRVRWLLDEEILPGWGTWRVLLIATLWTIWLFLLAIRDTGDGMSKSPCKQEITS